MPNLCLYKNGKTVATNAYRMLICAVFIFFLFACNDASQQLESSPAPLETQYPVDGKIHFDAANNIQSTKLYLINMISNDLVKQINVRWMMENDDRNFYIGIEWSDDTNHSFLNALTGEYNYDMLRMRIDNNGNGVYEENEDHRRLIAVSTNSLYQDGHSNDFVQDVIGDGMGKMAYDAERKVWQAEFIIPIKGDVRGEDADLSSNTRFNLVFYDNYSPDSGNWAVFGDGFDSSSWPKFELHASPIHAYPELPDDLTGLFVFVSTHEVPVGAIYTYDPATKLVKRVTRDETLHKNSVTLSHDRTKIAFHGTRLKTSFDDPLPKEDLGSFEIYVVDVDGSNLKQLTNNSYMNLHPAWSPDDNRIAYSSFREFPNASTIVMTADGSQEIADLTPDGVDDSDVEYLLDGRLVFKTSRFNDYPILNMAVINEDGSGLSQITYKTNRTDHDAIGDPTSTFILFERFMKGTDYRTDPDAVVPPWNIIEARVDGTGERSIVADGWINTTPIYDPSGEYIAYIRLPAYNEVRLVTRDGKQLGRFIPDITSIEFIDWK